MRGVCSPCCPSSNALPRNGVPRESNFILLARLILTDPMQMVHPSQSRTKLIFLGMLLGGLAFSPVPLNAAFSVCGFRWLTGVPCPLCGMTRALSLLLKGQWELAWRLHSLSPIVLSLLLAAFLNEMLGFILPTQFPLNLPSRFTHGLCLGLVVCFSCYGFFRLLIAT